MKSQPKNGVSMWLRSLELFALISALTLSTPVLAVDSKLPQIREVKLDQACSVANQLLEPFEYYITLHFRNEFDVLRGRVEIKVRLADPKPAPESLVDGSKCHTGDDSKGTVIVLHLARRIEIHSVTLENDYYLRRESIKDILRDSERQMIVIRLNEPLADNSSGRLIIEYEDSSFSSSKIMTSGTMDDYEFVRDGGDRPFIYRMARLQPGQARELLPCFEESHIKTRINLEITYPGKLLNIYSNTIMSSSNERRPQEEAGQLIGWHEFDKTEPMPIGSLTFAIVDSRDEQTGRTTPDRRAKITIIPPKEKSHLCSYASEFGWESYQWLQKKELTLRIPREELRLLPVTTRKNGLKMATGYMIGYIDRDILLLNDVTAPEENKMRAGFHIALTMTRQFFGNLLVPRTYADMWITEGLAGYTALKMIDQLRPEWDVFAYFRSNYLNRALELDSSGKYPPISYVPLDGDTSNDKQAALFYSSEFELMRFGKGVAIIQMLDRIVSPLSNHGISFDDVIKKLIGSSKDMLVDLPLLANAFANEHLSSEEIVNSVAPWIESSEFP
uniref:Leucyl aminopeptidase n=1 Tax=Aceria tosichella TaxID=561515 RepID=A0A6G1S9R5_9ACAR